MKLFGVTGHPVLHSRSPQIFARLFALDGTDAAYTRVAARTADDALSCARRIGMRGLTVTSPFKEAVCRLATAGDESASRLGAANTLLLSSGGVLAFNTDPAGVRRALAAGPVVARGACVVVLGAGAAALAAGAALIDDGADVVVTSRAARRAAEAAARLGCECADFSALPDLLPKAAGLVSCLPQGVDPIDERSLHAGLWILDSNCGWSPLAEKARRRGCVALDGTNWLVGQALAARRVLLSGAMPPAEPADVADDVAASEIGRLVTEADSGPGRRGLALAGMMGAGKSTVGREIARRLGRELADTDDLIVERTGHDIRWLFDHGGEEEFRRIEADTVARAIDSGARVIALGGGSLERRATATEVRRQYQVVWLWASPACLAARLAAEAAIRPLLDGADLEPRSGVAAGGAHAGVRVNGGSGD